MLKAEREHYKKMNTEKISLKKLKSVSSRREESKFPELKSREFRRARTRSLVQLGGLMDKSGLLKTFEIPLGLDLQKDPETKEPVAALYKGLLVLNEIANSEEVYLPLWSQQGLEALAKK